MAVVKINDFFMTSISLLAAETGLRCLQNMLTECGFRFANGPVNSPEQSSRHA